MRPIIINLWVITFLSVAASAQIVSASLKADGLTCSLCNRSVQQALEKLTFIDSVTPDLPNTAFEIAFKSGQAPDLDKIAAAVRAAGFSVGRLSIRLELRGADIRDGIHLVSDSGLLHIVATEPRTLSGTVEFRLVDRPFLGRNEAEQWAKRIDAECYRTGRSAACCPPAPDGQPRRVYHVTL